ncbi:MAG: hypothetical protein ACTHLW_12155 [Verrucomicrobiota bacterium]
MKQKEKNPILETADQNLKNYEQALRTGLKIQEDTWQSWSSILSQSQIGPDWQKRFGNVTGTTNAVVPAVQKGLVETVDLMGKNAILGAELMKKAVDAAQTPAIAESQSKWMDFVKTSLEAAQYNVAAVMRINTRAMDSMFHILQRNSEFARHQTSKTA